MAKIFVQNGHVMTFTATADVVSGQVIKLNGLVGVVLVDALTGEVSELATTGVYQVAKTSADTPSQFQKAYWNDTAKEFTTVASGNTLVGCFTEAYGNGDTMAHVRFNGVAV